MPLTLPEVEPVALKLRSQADLKSAAAVDVSNDYGQPNLLFLYYVPFLPDDRKPDLDAIQDEFQTWNAWELGQTEVQLNGHVQAGRLPSDDSIASRIARNQYRSKAIDYFRQGNQTWLTVATHVTGQKVVETTEEGFHSSVREQLKLLAAEHGLQGQFGVILNTISGRADVEKENKFFYTHVYYRYDADSRKFLPVIADTIFTVAKQDGGGQAGNAFTIAVNLTFNSYSFDRKFWRDHRHEGEEAIRLGEPIRKQMAMDFYVNN